MAGQENLVEIMGELGQPPAGVDIETYAIANVEPGTLHDATSEATPIDEGFIKMLGDYSDYINQISEDPQPEMRLALSIVEKQHRLSKARRVAATSLATFTVATGMGALYYESVSQNYPSSNKQVEILTSAGIGSISGFVGGLAGYFAGINFSHRLARRPAQRIVQKAEQI